jgi:hypothetical protein
MGTGPTFTLPFPEDTVATPANSFLGSGFITDVTTNIFGCFIQSTATPGTVTVRAWGAGGTYVNFATVNATIPITWASTHYMDLSFIYKALTF